MTISSKQIRAARGLLGISQKELAAKSGLSVNSLNNIERDVGSPRADSLNAIRGALQSDGVEFMDRDGVRLAGEQLEIERIEGPVVMRKLYEDCLKTFPRGHGELLMMGKDNERFRSHELERLRAYKQFEAFAIKNGIKERLLFLDGDTNFLSERNHYRWVPRELFGKVPMAIYGHNVAIVLWGPPRRLVIIRNQGIADTFRQHFEALWSLGKPVPDAVHRQHYAQKTQRILDEAAADDDGAASPARAFRKKPVAKPASRKKGA